VLNGVPMDFAVLFTVCEPTKLGSPIAKSNHCLRCKANLCVLLVDVGMDHRILSVEGLEIDSP
jgi:hypothetical protein